MEIHVKSLHVPAVLSLKSAELPHGVSVDVPPVVAARDISEAWATAIFSVAASVPASVIAGILIEKFKDKKSTIITINRKEIHFEKGEIIKAIEESKSIEQ
jgi:hypothetical protein